MAYTAMVYTTLTQIMYATQSLTDLQPFLSSHQCVFAMKRAVGRTTLHGEVNARSEALGLCLGRRERIRCWVLATASWRRHHHRDKKMTCLACIAQIIEADVVGEGLAVTTRLALRNANLVVPVVLVHVLANNLAPCLKRTDLRLH